MRKKRKEEKKRKRGRRECLGELGGKRYLRK